MAGSPRVQLESKGWYEEAVRFYEIVEHCNDRGRYGECHPVLSKKEQ
jgi:hypothetical protein